MSKSSRNALLPGCQTGNQRTHPPLCFRCHQLRAYILHIENQLCSEEFRDQSREYEKIWHIMYMGIIVSKPFQETVRLVRIHSLVCFLLLLSTRKTQSFQSIKPGACSSAIYTVRGARKRNNAVPR